MTVPKVTFHVLRRTAVRNLDRSGVRRDVAKSIIGHLTDAAYSRYDIGGRTTFGEAIERASSYPAEQGAKA